MPYARKEKAGRKAINLDHNEIERLAGMGLNERQICASLGLILQRLQERNILRA